MSSCRTNRWLSVSAGVVVWLVTVDSIAAQRVVVFSRDVAPILAARCFRCHGPDSSHRKADLQLDQLDRPTRSSSGRLRLIEPHHPDRSLLIRRIVSRDPNLRMPPPAHGPRLAPAQIDTIRRWIDQGARNRRHWAFVSPVRPSLPPVRDSHWPRSPIDSFILHGLESRQLAPSPPANPFTRLRRLSLHLTGLPPTPAEITSWLEDRRPGAWNRAVERLLASPRHGEQMARGWLDAARYADTTGHAADRPRTMWLYRDWVIDAFNANMPFNRFTIEQLAGDMLPDPSVRQRVATGFHRNSIQALGNNPRKEEFRIKGIVDRLDTTGRVWLGLTIACAECHNHKYDPVSQREYYRLFAVFNNVPHVGEKFEVRGPRIQVLPATTRSVVEQLERELAAMDSRKGDARRTSPPGPSIADDLRSWARRPRMLLDRQSPLLRVGFDGSLDARRDDGSRLPASADSPRLEVSAFSAGPVKGIAAVRLKPKQSIAFNVGTAPSISGDFSIGLWVRTTRPVADLVSQYDWRSGRRAYVFGIGGESDAGSRPGRLFTWISRTAKAFDGAVVNGSIPVNDGRWHHVAMSYTAGASISLYVDGQLDSGATMTGRVPPQPATASLPLVLGAGFNNSSRPNDFFIDGQLADIRIFDRPLNGIQLGGLPAATRRSFEDFTRSDATTVPPLLRSLHEELVASFPTPVNRQSALVRRIGRLKQNLVTAQVMTEMDQPRPTFIHLRGNFENRGPRVQPGLPRPLSGGRRSREPVNRLALARRLVDGSNPLVARVIVNRIWAHHFGSGLVRTTDDFGVRGDYPSHPDLLDWLAVEFVESGWDLKHMHRLIVTSATFQQSSTSDSGRTSNPRWLSRFPRRRLHAEQIRDAALQASGALVNRLGGPSVYPPQPPGIGQFRDATAGTWVNSRGPGRYRRSLYTFWQRMSPYPSMVLFDAPSRERCTVDRPSTNTPLQALALLNAPHHVDLARRFGERIRSVSRSPIERIRFGFLTILSRPPEPGEQQAFLEFAGDRSDPETWFRLAQVLLNLDEAISCE